MVAGGTVVEWGELSDERWHERIARLGAVAAAAGARWLTLRPRERGAAPESGRPIHHAVVDVEGCTVIVDPTPDGKERLVVALRKLAESDQLSEATVASALLAPADAEPDLVVVLGPTTCLPTSLVWELAYSELVYVPARWDDLGAEHLVHAMHAFRHRHRRFGGLD